MIVGHQFLHLGYPAWLHTDDGTTLRFTEVERLAAHRSHDARTAQAKATEERTLRQRNQQAAIRHIVGGA